MSDAVPMNEEHRFLRWLSEPEDVRQWELWLSARGIPHAVGVSRDGWTIYRHLWDHSQGRYCCG